MKDKIVQARAVLRENEGGLGDRVWTDLAGTHTRSTDSEHTNARQTHPPLLHVVAAKMCETLYLHLKILRDRPDTVSAGLWRLWRVNAWTDVGQCLQVAASLGYSLCHDSVSTSTARTHLCVIIQCKTLQHRAFPAPHANTIMHTFMDNAIIHLHTDMPKHARKTRLSSRFG